MSTQVSIIICTCNRVEHLRQTLESLAKVCVPTTLPTEVIVVDNASTDGTAKLVQMFNLPNMTIRYLYEPHRGKSYGLNRAMAQAEGRIFLFTDDDLRFSPNWLACLCQPIECGEADAVMGTILIAPHLIRPWMDANHKIKMASNEHIDPKSEFRLIGANMAFSRSVLAQVPQFDVELGPGALGFVDDSLFSRQLRKAGCRLVIASDAVVIHHFDPDRLTRASFQSRALKQGKSEAYVAHHWEHWSSSSVYKNLVRQGAYLLYWHFRRWIQQAGPEGAPQWEMEILQRIGFNQQMLIERRRPRNYDKHGLIKHKGLQAN